MDADPLSALWRREREANARLRERLLPDAFTVRMTFPPPMILHAQDAADISASIRRVYDMAIAEVEASAERRRQEIRDFARDHLPERIAGLRHA